MRFMVRQAHHERGKGDFGKALTPDSAGLDASGPPSRFGVLSYCMFPARTDDPDMPPIVVAKLQSA